MQTQLSNLEGKLSANSGRLESLDILRGFDMFWIVGGIGFVAGLLKLIFGYVPQWYIHHITHVEWNGFAAIDLVFPLFLFISGVTAPFSFAKAKRTGKPAWRVILHIGYRGLALVLLGIIYNGGLRFDFANMRIPSVLGRIGLAWMFAALIIYYFKFRWQVVWAAGLLALYYCLMKFVPVPEIGAGVWEPGKTLADFVDQQLLGAHLYVKNVRDPEGILATIPAISTAILGALAGELLRSEKYSRYAKFAILIACGVGAMILGKGAGLVMPINKNLWSSSFVLWAGGISSILLGLFYLVVDIWQFKKWGFFFKMFGMNSIAIYMFWRIVDLNKITFTCFKTKFVAPELVAVYPLLIGWLFVYYLYKRKIFLRL